MNTENEQSNNRRHVVTDFLSVMIQASELYLYFYHIQIQY